MFSNLWKYNRDESRVDVCFRIGKIVFFELFWDEGSATLTLFNFRWRK